jgi:ribose 1,5-bisphosphokinase
MAGIAAQLPHLALVRRTITRDPDLGGEAYDAVAPEKFDQMVDQGAFCIHWGAHDLRYGIPSKVLRDVVAGAEVLANFSRSALLQANAIFPAMTVLNITASDAVLAQRLRGRKRECDAQIAKRLAQAAKPLPAGIDVITLYNDGPLRRTVDAAVKALHPVRA